MGAMATGSEWTLEDLARTLLALAVRRPVFHSEADFQHAFAWQVQLEHPEARIRLETRPRPGVRLDVLVVLNGRRIALELKYLLRRLTVTVDDELFDLPSQGAQDVRRYDFIKDISRLEVLRADDAADDCFAVALTNDPSYWNATQREDVTDAAFRIPEGRQLAGVVEWAAHTGAGTMRGRESSIPLRGAYALEWRDYSRLSATGNRVFRYLAVQVM
jgi:hypothetical protein